MLGMLEGRCAKALGVIRVVAHSGWGVGVLSFVLSLACPIWVGLWLHSVNRVQELSFSSPSRTSVVPWCLPEITGGWSVR